MRFKDLRRDSNPKGFKSKGIQIQKDSNPMTFIQRDSNPKGFPKRFPKGFPKGFPKRFPKGFVKGSPKGFKFEGLQI